MVATGQEIFISCLETQSRDLALLAHLLLAAAAAAAAFSLQTFLGWTAGVVPLWWAVQCARTHAGWHPGAESQKVWQIGVL